MKYDYLIVGAGFAGSVFAERLATQANKKILVVEKRNHIGGNAYDEFDEYGILVHKYGPHIFHTNSKNVFKYLSLFTKWRKYEHKVLANYKGKLYPIPINRVTLNLLYGYKFNSKGDVDEYLTRVKEDRHPISNSEDFLVSRIGNELFEIFYKHYSKKHWDLFPHELSATVCRRIPIRNNEDCRYFSDKYQFMPMNGYTQLFKNMLEHKNIEVALNTDYKNVIDDVMYDKLIFTGSIDDYFNNIFGKLPYRSIRFEFEHFKENSFQRAAQINYVDEEKLYTRVIEHKKLSGNNTVGTTISREYPLFEGEPLYPIPNKSNNKIYYKYKKEADKLKNVIFCGRLAEYKYWNMDQIVEHSLNILRRIN
ncbi:MAG: UDP-galactopyranose mutase [Bacteroidetes bacterium]|nr:UDP-galactopyranose mutase [Bacteroidota bacterium]